MRDPIPHWPAIRRVVNRSFASSLHFSFATVDDDGAPRVCPIGSLLLYRHEPRGYYFEIFTDRTAKNLSRDGRVSVLAVDSGRWLWLKALATGRFASPPGVRLIGTSGAPRPPTPDEIERWWRRIPGVRRLRGAQALWGNMERVRDVTFHGFEPVELGSMTRDAWSDPTGRPRVREPNPNHTGHLRR